LRERANELVWVDFDRRAPPLICDRAARKSGLISGLIRELHLDVFARIEQARELLAAVGPATSDAVGFPEPMTRIVSKACVLADKRRNLAGQRALFDVKVVDGVLERQEQPESGRHREEGDSQF
jgi:hypothetical protein